MYHRKITYHRQRYHPSKGSFRGTIILVPAVASKLSRASDWVLQPRRIGMHKLQSSPFVSRGVGCFLCQHSVTSTKVESSIETGIAAGEGAW